MLYFANKYFIFIFFGISFAFAANISKAKVDLWKKLKEPKYVLAPMVDYSELAWRLLCRRHGAQLCYTPMLNSIDFVKNPEHRKKDFITCSEDRPLIVQLSANDPETLLKAALLVQDHCDCIDINLGSPLPSAKKGNFGAYLQEDWKLVSEMVKMLSKNLRVPVSCKIRIFPEISKTVTYSQMLENSGCQLITVHGRTLEQVGPKTGLASWAHIKAVRQAVNIPVIANGNIRCLEDVNRCLRETGCHGVMSAEGLLHNPALFEGSNCTVWEAALEYLDLVKLYTSPLSIVRNHLLKLFLHLFAISENANVQSEIIAAQDIYRLENIVKKIEALYKPIHEGHQTWNHKSLNNSCFPPWICQPRIRKEFKNDEIVQKNHDNKDKQVKSQKNLRNLQYNCSNCSAV